MIYIIFSIGGILVFFLAAKFIVSRQFTGEVESLFAQSKPIEYKIYNLAQLEGLPEPVQKYFKKVMKDDQPYISYARLQHDGQFKTGKDKSWVEIEGEQYFTIQKPGFVWKGNTSMFTARDMYVGNKGRLVVFLLSVFKILDGKGAAYNQGELLRWLAESVWFPTNLLPTPYLSWKAIDGESSKLLFEHDAMSLSYIVRFLPGGEISEMETKRFMDEKNLETWIGKMTDYKEINQVWVPTKIEALWRLADGDLSYARFHLKRLEYDMPERF